MITAADIGASFIKLGKIKDGKIIDGKTLPTSDYLDAARLIAEFANGDDIGVCAAGTVRDGVITFSPNLGTENVDFAAIMRGLTGKSVYVGNDADCAAYGEYVACGAPKNTVFITLGTGIGGGIIIDGKLLQNGAGEVGHMTLRQNGKKCACGRRGCWERYASASALTEITSAAAKKAKIKLPKIVAGTVFSHLDEDWAKGALDEFIANLGDGIMSLLNILRPQAVIIGGGLSVFGDKLLPPLTRYLSDRDYGYKNSPPCELYAARLGNDAGMIGAALLAENAAKTL